MYPSMMLKKEKEINYKQFSKEEVETETKISIRKKLLAILLLLTIILLLVTLVYITVPTGYLCKRFPDKGRVITRQEWKNTDDELAGESVVHPVSNVLVQHTQTDPCNTEEDCKNFMRDNQNIDSNFYIGADGNMYEGTGWDVMVQTMDFELTNSSVTIRFIGTYITMLPNEDQLQAGRQLLLMGVNMGKICTDYQLFPGPQYPDIESPQINLLKMLNTTQLEPSVIDV